MLVRSFFAPADLKKIMVETPKGLRLHIGLFGKRNAGKSSLINALTNQKISIVSEVAGTTTDPVEKACELAPIGPVVFIDTAGVDDVGALGLARVERTRAVLEWVDIALVVANARDFDECESDLVEHLRKLGTPAVLVINKSDLHPADEAFMTRMRAYGIPVMKKYDEKDGTLGKVLFGTPSGGVGLYVPESMLEDAKNLLAPVEESTRNEEES